VVVLRDTPSAGPRLPSDDGSLDVALDADWLGSALWGLLILGTVLLVVAFVTLAWPGRPRDADPEPVDDGDLTSLLDPADDGTLVALPADTAGDGTAAVPSPDAAPRRPPVTGSPVPPEQRVPAAAEPVRAQPDAPWAGAPYTGPAVDALLEDTVAWPAPSAQRAPRSWFEPVDGPGHAETVTVARTVGVPGMRNVPAPDLPWPPLRGALPATQPVREVLPGEFLRGFADRPACTLRLERVRAVR
jgi:hypothetical protein